MPQLRQKSLLSLNADLYTGDLEDTPVYDLMGRRVTNMKPGNIYIRKQGSAKANGKKILFGKH